jgi:hypothetical protein
LPVLINVRFVRDGVAVGFGRYAALEAIPDVVTLSGVPHGTVGTDESGRTASHSSSHGSSEIDTVA